MAWRRRNPKKTTVYSARRIVKTSRGGDRLLKQTFQYQRNKRGFLKIVRKMPEYIVRNTNLTGGVEVRRSDGVLDSTIVNIGSAFTNAMGSYDVPFSLRFRLDQLINAADIGNLADKYQIKVAYIRLRYNTNADQAAAGGAPTLGQSSNLSLMNLPYVEYIQDYDDATAPPSVASLRERMGVKFKSFKNHASFIKIKCFPRPTKDVYVSPGVAGAIEVSQKPVWIDTASASVEHYGIKGIIHNMPLLSSTTNLMFSGVTFDIALKVYAKDFQ